MGILNVTPDSFSDGGRFLEPQTAIEHGRELIAEGADIVDVGGESTRPGAREVSAREELARVRPVIEGLMAERDESGAVISVDTSKASVAAAALRAGASFINDVTALRGDAQMVGVVADSGAQCCLMHMLGDPRTMQRDPRYEDVVSEVKSFLEERLAFAVREGVREQQVLLDPGIGFGKTVAHNLALLARLDELVSIGRPIVVGTSRKSFLARLTTRPSEPHERLAGTLATSVLAFERGASVLRVHDVAPAREALEVAAATLGGRWTASSPPKTPTS
ncbi:MAG: dihydropteroate synthase [Actinobacteria bacterium]|nr:MAG: dihydropteroate synthase [Actinomycetota bacterium]